MQYIYHRLKPTEINTSKVKLCKFQNRRQVKVAPPVNATPIVVKKIEFHFTATKIENASLFSLLKGATAVGHAILGNFV